MIAVSHNKLVFNSSFFCILSWNRLSLLKKQAINKQINYVQQKEGKLLFTHLPTIWHPKTKIFYCCFVRLMQVGIKSSIICLAEFSQAVQTHPVPLCSCDQGDLVFVPKNPCVYISGLEVLRSQVKRHGTRSALPPSESFIMVN